MGVFYLVAVIPFVMIISSLCAQLRQETATVSDHRISMMIELISGIRALKANALENSHKDRIQEVRRYERTFREIALRRKKNIM